MAKIIQLIATSELAGDGKSSETGFRRVLQLWTKGGLLAVTYDPLTGTSWVNPTYQPLMSEDQ